MTNSYSLPLSLYKIVAIALSLALILWSLGTGFLQYTHAASLTEVSDLLSDSDLGVGADHTITFSAPTAIPADDSYYVITFPGEFNVSTSSVTVTDIDVDHGAGDLTLASGGCVAQDIDVAIGTNAITFTACNAAGGALGAGGTSTIEIGTHSSGGTTNQMVNAEQAGSYVINIESYTSGDALLDSADTRVVVIDDVIVTASVDTIFEFVINGLPAGMTINGSATTTATTTTATSIPFETLAPGISKVLAQNLQVTTNARNGYTVTLNQNQNLLSSTGADIDSFTNDTGIASSTFWEGPTGGIGSENEYGHMGITSEDETLSSAPIGFYDDLWAGNFVGNPREVMYHDGPADGIETDTGSTTVGFQAEIMSFQEAGDDYTAVITYVATPTF